MKPIIRNRLLVITMFYFLAANLTFIDKLWVIDDWDLGINLDYWGSNSAFLGSLIFWFNMFLYSAAPVLMASVIMKDRLLVYSSLALPIYWGYLLFLSIIDAGSESLVLIPQLRYFVYSLLIISSFVFIIKTILIIRGSRIQSQFDELEKFKRRALKRLAKLNPQQNQELFREVVGANDEAITKLVKANMEEDETRRHYLIRMALDEVCKETESIDRLQRRLSHFSELEYQ